MSVDVATLVFDFQSDSAKGVAKDMDVLIEKGVQVEAVQKRIRKASDVVSDGYKTATGAADRAAQSAAALATKQGAAEKAALGTASASDASAKAAEREAAAWLKVEAALNKRNAAFRGDQALETVKAATAAKTAAEAEYELALRRGQVKLVTGESAAAAAQLAAETAKTTAVSTGAASAAAQMAEAIAAQTAADKLAIASAGGLARAHAETATAGKAVASAAEQIAAAQATATTSTKAFTASGKLSEAGIEAYQAKIIAATMAQAGMTEAQARAALGFKAVAAATNEGAEAAKVAGAIGVAASEAQVVAQSRVVGSSLKVRESLVLMREAARGDFTRMAGSASILAGSFGLITAATLPLILGLAAVAAVIGTVVFAIAKGQEQMSKFDGSLIATGNYAGMTASRWDGMAKSIAESSNTTVGSVRKIESEFVASGKFGAQAIQSATDAVANYSRITGEDAEKIAKEYDGMKDHLIQWAVKHEDVYHDLTVQQLDHIARLIKEGKEAEAQAALLADIDEESKKRLQEKTAEELKQMGFLEQSMHGMIILASKFWDALLGIGRGKTLDEQIKDQTQAVLDSQDRIQATITRGTANGKTPLTPGQLASMKATLAAETDQLKTLQGQKTAEDQKANAEAEAAAKRHDEIQKKYGDGKPRGAGKADPVAERLQALAAEAQGNRLLATSTDLTTVAGVKALAMQKALADAAKATRAGVDLNTQAEKFYAAELAVVVTAAAKQAEEEAAATNAKSKATQEATALVQKLGVSQGVANQMAADSNKLAELRAAYDAAALRDKPMLAKAIADTAAAQERKNRADQEAFLAQSHQAAADQLDQLKLEAELIGKTNEARAVAIAQLKEEQTLRLNGVKATLPDGLANPAYTNAVDDAGKVARETVKLTQKQDAFNQSLSFTADMFSLIAQRAQDAAADIGGSFGKVGSGIGAVLATLTAYDAKQAAIAAERQRLNSLGKMTTQEAARLDEQSSAARIKNYGDMTSAAASFFGKQTAAYKVLQGAEAVFRAFELASAIKSFITKTALKATETAVVVGASAAQATAVVAAETVSTGATLAGSLLRIPVLIAEGAARMFAHLGPLGFIAVAAMLAVMVGLGFGGGGGASAPTIPDQYDSEKVQAAQGAGSVLGDSKAKSSSIQHSLEIVAKNSNSDLEYSNQMVLSLRNIDEGITSLTAAIARTIGVSGGLFDTSKLNIGTSSKSGFLGLFGGSTTTRTLTDAGLQLSAGNLADILAKGISGVTYQVVQSVKTSKGFLGFGGGTKTSYDTTNSALDADIEKQFTDLLRKLRDGVVAAGDVIGVDGSKAILDAFQVSIGKISFQGMDAQGIQDTINAVFSKVGDQMAGAILPSIQQFQQAGEGAFETLVRLAREYQVVDVSLEAAGMSFGAVGLASIAARDSLVKLFDSLDDFQSKTQFFTENFLTEAQQMAPIQAAIVKEFQRLGVSGVNTKAQFAQLVQSLDLTTQTGREMYASLLAIAPAFAKVDAFLNPDAANNAADGWKSVFESLTDWIRSLKDEITSSVQSTAQAYAALQAAALAARGGDVTAAGKIIDLGNAYLSAEKASATSEFEYLQAVARVRAIASSVQAYAGSQPGVATGATGSTTPFSPATSATGATAPSYTYTAPAPTPATAPTVTTIDSGATQAATDATTLATAYAAGTKAALYQQWYGGFADGGAFTNGVVTRPTTFNMAQMGEAGPEGILPLTNVGGRLGVHAIRSANDNSDLLDAIEALTAEVAELRAEQRAVGAQIAINTGKSAKIADRWEGDGLPPTRDEAA